MESQIQCVGSVTTLEPRKVLELSSKEYLQGSNLYYLESQFITRERESLAIIGISFDDIYLLDKMYLLCKALPYYQIIAQKPLVDSRSPFSMKSQAAQTLADSSTSSRNDSHSAHTASKDDFVMQNESNHYKSNFHAGREIFNRNKYGTNSQGKEFCNASAYQQNNNGIRDINEGGSYQSNKHYLKERGHQTNFPISKMIDKNEGFQRCPHTSNQENGLKTRSNKCLNGFKSENGTSRPPQVIQNGQRTTGQYKYSNKVENLEDDASICSETSVKRNLKFGNFSNQVIQDHENPHLTACEKPNKANSHCEVSIVRDHPAPLLNNTFPSTDEAPAITVETEKFPLNTLPDTKVAPGIVVEIEKSPLNTLPATKIVPTAQTEKSPLNTLPATKKAPGIVVETEKSPLNTLPTTKIVPTVQTEKYPLLPATEVVPAITVQSNKSVPGPTETYEVVFGDKQQNNYFVIKQKDLTALDAMEMKLAQETLQIWSDQCEDKKVVVVCDGRHYRGIITQNNTKIKLVDVGWFLTFDNRNSSDVFVLPEKFRTIKPLAFPVNIDDAHHISRNTRCTIDETGLFDEKVKRVKVKQVSAVISDVPSKCDNVSKQSLSSQQVSHLLTLNTPLSVIYILREDGNPENHFVQDTKYASVYDTWQELANEQNNLNSMPQLGDLCLAMAEGEWVRTKVVALEPLTVYHFDYGSSEVVGKFEELKFTPKVMSTLAPLAYKIKFFNVKNNEKAYEFGNQFQITPIDFFNDVYTVLKDDETSPLLKNNSVIETSKEATQVHKTQENVTTSKSADYKYKSAAINENSVELNKQTEEMYLQEESDVPSKHDNVGKQSLSSQQVPHLTLNIPLSVIYTLREDSNPENHFVQDTKYSSVYDTWQELANEQKNLNSMPQLGDLCLAMAEGEWVRTKVVALEPLTVYHFDYGSSEVVGKFEELKSTPKVMSTLAPLAYKIKFFNVKNNEKAYEFGNQFQITPIDFFNDVYTVLKDDETPLEPLFENISVKAIREATQVHKTQENATTSKSADYKYKSAAINENSVELNKQIEVMYLQDDENNRNHIWVQTSGFAEPMLIWQEKCDSSKATFNHGTAQPGDFCIKMYDEFWCRAKILSINPLILFYIDFGNVEDVENISQIKPLPEELACLKPLALKVQYYDDDENRQPMEYGDLFFITPTQLKNDVYIVLKGNENLLTTTVKETQRIRYDFKDCAISKPSVLELNKPVEVGFVENDIHDPSHKWVQESKFYEFLKNWTEISNALTTKFVSEPTVGEYCIILYEDTWCRGQIVNVEPLTIFCVDYGNECVIQNHSEIKPLPTQLSLEKPFAHKIQFFNKANADVTYNFADLFTITPIEVIGSVLIVLKGSEVISSVKSMMYESPVPSLSLNEETVAVWMQEDEFDPQYTWVQDINNVELLGSFNSMLNESTSKLTQMPQLGNLCGKQFDGIWCRAKVVCLNPLTLFYIDYGNIEEVSSNEIKPLPPSLSKYPALAYRIKFPFGGKPKAESNECGKFTPVAFEDNVYSVTNVTMQT